MTILEVWRPIREAPYFAVSNHGRVQSLLSGEIMEEYVEYEGDDIYLGVNLLDEQGNEFSAPIDGLVVEAFLEPVDGMSCVIHIDGDPWNNFVWNLCPDEDLTYAYFNCD